MIKNYDIYEEVVKQVVPFGNGSIVYTPKKWIGQTVRVILEGEPVNIKESVVELLQPFLENIKGVFLYGSFARNEQAPDSDIDVLVVADKKFKLEKKSRFDFTVIEEATLRKELKGKDPFYTYLVLQEAKPIINKALLKELKEIKINKCDFKWLLEEAESALKIAEEFLKLDKLQERKKLDSTAIVHTIVLRLKNLFWLQCILKNEKYSNKEFKSFLHKKGLPKELIEKFYDLYRAERDEKGTPVKVSVEDTEKLYEVAKRELIEMREVLHKCLQKRKHSKE
ncbi:MAG: DUF2080 family transposase-associated protein [Candidatus Diapherotrites archaeon]